MRKMLSFKLAFALVAYFFVNCKSSKNQVNRSSEIIEIHFFCEPMDESGKVVSLKIRKDSTTFLSGSQELMNKLISETETEKWKELTKLLNIQDFTKLESSMLDCMQVRDCDSPIVSIKTQDTVISKPGIMFDGTGEGSITIKDLLKIPCN